MQKNNVIKVISIIIGTIIGAGFASGKEIFLFFKIYQGMGIIGIIFSCLITAIIIYVTLKIAIDKKIENNEEFLQKITKNNISKNILKIIINAFLIISFFIMIAGWSAFFKQKYNIPTIITSLIMSILLYFTFMKNIDGIMKINGYIIPILIIIVIYIATTNINRTEPPKFENVSRVSALLSAMLYSSYNSIILIPILISSSKIIKNEKQIKIITIITAIILAILSICIFQILSLAKFNINYVELPILKILEKNKIQEILYSIVVVIAIFTSAISAGFGILENIKTKEKYKKAAFVLCFLSIPISYIGFGKLINIMYPVFGAIGIYQIALLCYNSKNK